MADSTTWTPPLGSGQSTDGTWRDPSGNLIPGQPGVDTPAPTDPKAGTPTGTTTTPGAVTSPYFSRYGSGYSSDTPTQPNGQKTQEQIQGELLASASGELNGLSDYYRTKLKQQQEVNATNERGVSSKAVLEGLAGSSDANTAIAKASDTSRLANDAIIAEHQAKTGELLRSIRDSSYNQFNTNNANARLDATAHAQAVKDAEEQAGTHIKQLVTSGVTFDGLKTSAPSEYQALLKVYGSDSALKGAFILNTPTATILDKKIENGKYVIATQNPITGKISVQTLDLGLPPGYTKTIDAGNQILAVPDNWTGDPKDLISIPKGVAPTAGSNVSPNDPTAQAWAKAIGNKTAKWSDVPAGYKNAVAQITGTQPNAVSETSRHLIDIATQLGQRDTNVIAGVPGVSSFFPGTGAQQTKNLATQLQGLLSLENRNLLKGSGAISDYEARTLEKASSALGIRPDGTSNLSDADFKAGLDQLVYDLSHPPSDGSSTGGGDTNLTSDELQQLRDAFPGKTDAELIQEATGGGPQSFNDVGNTTASVSIPKGTLAYKNNNPGNLRFVGQPGASQGVGGFAMFDSPQAGFDALVRQTQLDASRGLTLADFVYKYAPPSENNSSEYLSQVSRALGVPHGTPIAQIDPTTLAKVIARKESSTQVA